MKAITPEVPTRRFGLHLWRVGILLALAVLCGVVFAELRAPEVHVHVWTRNEAERAVLVGDSLQLPSAVAMIDGDDYTAQNGPEPSVGLYWYASFDPTTGAGMAAPLNQLLVRTDTPSIYYKSGAANTAWTRIGAGASGGGTITGGGTAPDLTVWTGGTAIGNYGGSTPSACGAGQAITQQALSAAGALTDVCTAFAPAGNISGTTNTVAKFTSTTAVGNSSATDNGTNYVIGAGGFAVVEASGETEAPELDGTGVVVSLATSGTVNNWDPTNGSPGNLNGVFKVNQAPSSALILTGMIAGNAGQLIDLRNTSTTAADTIAINSESASSTAANRFTLPNAASCSIEAGASATFRYSGAASRWEPIDNGCTSTLVTYQNSTISPTDTGTLNDYNPTGLASATLIRMNNGTAATIDGIVGGQDARVLFVCAINSTVTLANEAAGSTAANRIWGVFNNSIILNGGTNGNACVELIYDVASSRWRTTAVNLAEYNVATFPNGITTQSGVLNTGGHFSTVGSTAPTFTSCGATPSPTIHGSDLAGRFTTGGGITACTVDFTTTYTSPPACVVTAEGTATPPTYTNTATTIALSVVAATTTYDYVCIKVQ